MRVDLRRCDRCHGEFDANQVPNSWDIKRPDGCPLDFCHECTTILASIINELPSPEVNLANGVHIAQMVTKGYADYLAERVRHELDRGLEAAERHSNEVAARPLVIP